MSPSQPFGAFFVEPVRSTTAGDRFVVKCTDESGWIETECGAHLWPTWLVRSGEETSTRLQNVSLADDEVHPPKEEEVLEFQLDKADGSFGFKVWREGRAG